MVLRRWGSIQMKNANVDCCFVICFESQNQKVCFNSAGCRSLWNCLAWIDWGSQWEKHWKTLQTEKKSKRCFKLNSLHSMIEMLGQNWQKYFDIFKIFYDYFFYSKFNTWKIQWHLSIIKLSNETLIRSHWFCKDIIFFFEIN